MSAVPKEVQDLLLATPEEDAQAAGSGVGGYGRWFTGKYGWVLRDAVTLRKPVTVKSQLGLYRPTPALLARVNRQLPARRRIRAGEH